MQSLAFPAAAAAAVVLAIVLRVALAAMPHSGFQTPPLHGDFEAQRHWVEITNALPLREWYRNGTSNDLQYWGLDYPPLTAFHSLAIGRAARWVLHRVLSDDGAAEALWNQMFGLQVSRGSEDPVTIGVMQGSVLLSELAVYTVPCFAVARLLGAEATAVSNELGSANADEAQWTALRTMVVLAVFPLPMLLIDYGHFQFNAVSLGLAMWALYAVLRVLCHTGGADGRAPRSGPLLGWAAASVLGIVGAILFKQMSLYFALPFGGLYLGVCCRIAKLSRRPLGRALRFTASFLLLAVVGVGVAAAIFTPFLAEGTAGDVLGRMFPFGRGLYEDKVANVWCSISPGFKLPRATHSFLARAHTPLSNASEFRALDPAAQRQVTNAHMSVVCAVTTLLFSLPAVLDGLWTVATSGNTAHKHAADAKRRPRHKGGTTADELPSSSSPGTSGRSEAIESATGDRVALLNEYNRFFVDAERVCVNLFLGSMAFYLFSYQVHEKSILLPLLPALVLMCVRLARHDALCHQYRVAQRQEGTLELELQAGGGAADPVVALLLHFVRVALLSLMPLAVKDGNSAACGFMSGLSGTATLVVAAAAIRCGTLSPGGGVALLISAAAMTCAHGAFSSMTPPPQLPDLPTMVLICAAGLHFVCFYVAAAVATAIGGIPFRVPVAFSNAAKLAKLKQC